MAKGAPKGHPRWGGIKKGTKRPHTLEREAALKIYQQQILENLKPLIRSQLNAANGLTVMFQKKLLRNKKTGKLERTGDLVRVTNPERVEELLNGDCKGENYYYITIKDPNVKALEDLFNRVFGKPKETLEVDGGLDLNIDIKKIIDKIYG
jgi:hypothetical protein